VAQVWATVRSLPSADKAFAGALGLDLSPCLSAASIVLWHPPQFAVQPCTPAGEPAPLASLAEEDDNKVCLPAKRQRSSTLGIGTVYTPLVVCRKKHGVICRRTAHFDEQSSACLRENLRKENWSQNVKKLKLPTSKIENIACFGVGAKLFDGVTG